MSSLISASELKNIYQNDNVVLIDARSGQIDNYLKQHLEGALFVDLNEDLSDIKEDFADGGRHPLPTPMQFSVLLTNLGIAPTSHVIAYDDKNGANASSRFWWMLKAMGHEKIQVLNGGMQAAIKAGIKTSGAKEKVNAVNAYPFTDWKLPMSDINEIEQISEDSNFLVIDVRATDRYAGEREPIDLIAGHIPGAVNIPFATNLKADGSFLSVEELKNKYQVAIGDRPIEKVVIHCGSGVTACHSLLAMSEAGLDLPKLYVGSWSEWSRNNKKMITL